MNIVFSGLHGTGKSTIAQKIAEEFGFTFYSTGMVFRDFANEKGMNLEDFSKYVEENPEVDKKLDNRIINMARSGKMSGKNYVFDGQLPAYLLDDLADFKILLKCDEKTRIMRMAERDNKSFDDQKRETEIREKSEQNRFKLLYNIEVLDAAKILEIYNLILDTTVLNQESVFYICKSAIEKIILAKE